MTAVTSAHERRDDDHSAAAFLEVGSRNRPVHDLQRLLQHPMAENEAMSIHELNECVVTESMFLRPGLDRISDRHLLPGNCIHEHSEESISLSSCFGMRGKPPVIPGSTAARKAPGAVHLHAAERGEFSKRLCLNDFTSGRDEGVHGDCN